NVGSADSAGAALVVPLGTRESVPAPATLPPSAGLPTGGLPTGGLPTGGRWPTEPGLAERPVPVATGSGRGLV
ncbi:hypothetical protein M4438_37595, partial [Streptomyces lavenduligriseus]|nr:hypothetical protein [Streptomyces lavenduligriseus]